MTTVLPKKDCSAILLQSKSAVTDVSEISKKITNLNEKLRNIKILCEQNWEGPAAEAFKDRINEFLSETDKLSIDAQTIINRWDVVIGKYAEVQKLYETSILD